jgi:hypothetical protein
MSDSRVDPNRLGLAIGAAILAFIVVLMLVFSRHGLPKDPKEWRRIEQQRSATEAK